jgi:hypothetical protein
MRGVHLFMFLVAIPALAALGFDVYLYALDQDRGFMMTTPGYLLTHYYMDGYKWTVENTGEYWPYIDWVLAQKSVFVGVAFAAFWYVLLLILKILRLYPFNSERGTIQASGNRTNEILGNKSGKYKYKRK